MALNKEQILASQDLPRERMEVPEWGGEIWIRTFTGSERDAFEQQMFDRRDGKVSTKHDNIRAKFCVFGVCDENGNRIFTEADIAELGKKSGIVLDRITDRIRSQNGFTAKDVEALAKNSEGGRNDDSISD